MQDLPVQIGMVNVVMADVHSVMILAVEISKAIPNLI